MKVVTESQCKELISPKEAIDIALDVFKNLDQVVQPTKYYIDIPPNGDVRIMPAYLKYKKIVGTKIVTSYPNNVIYPTVNSVTVLVNHDNGATKAIVRSTHLTALRTGASGAIATKYLTNGKKDITIALIGAGVQAYTQLVCHLEMFNINKVYISDINYCKLEMFKRSFKDLDIVISDIETACKNSDVIITTTPVREPIVFDEWINDGTHINAIGADAKGKQELDHKILCRENTLIVCDSIEQCKHAGEINVPYNMKDEVIRFILDSNIICDMHELVTKGVKLFDDEVTIFDSTGIAALDVAFADRVIEKLKHPM